jgi:regulator of sirC expression with transglutaminase-like and TPR domain
MRAVVDPGDPKEIPDRQELLARLRDPQPGDATLPAEANLYLRHNPDDAEVKEARERLPSLDESE